MKIGLVRHFKVLKEYPQKKLISTNELRQWFKEYDEAEIEDSETDLGEIDWRHCYTSDVSRAFKTAEKIYRGEITQRTELREIPITYSKRNMKLPFLLWALLVRTSWIINRQSRLEIKAAKTRIEAILNEIMLARRDEDVLIVSHAALMMYIRKELKKRGFKTPAMGTPRNGKLYIFEKV